MAEMTKSKMLEIVDSSIEKLENKKFNVYFYVMDTKGNPSSTLEYIYKTAKILLDKGYNVSMLHNEKEFIGVSEWMGEEYDKIPHRNIETENIEIGPSDFLFIPEVFSNVMIQTKKLPCKRVIIVQDYQKLNETMPISSTPDMLGITDAIVITKDQENVINDYFPSIRTHIVHPSIDKVFKRNDRPKNLVVNVISRDQSIINNMIKPFYWKNPIYKWVSIRDMRGFTLEEYSDVLSTGAITIWIDDNTKFGYTLLEALRSGTLVLAKVPNKPTEWMLDENGELSKSIVWFDEIDDIPNILPSVIRSWTTNAVPNDIYELQKDFDSLYSEEQQSEEIEEAYVNGLFKRRLTEFNEVKSDIENNVIKTKDE